jgi:hypothetical protein
MTAAAFWSMQLASLGIIPPTEVTQILVLRLGFYDSGTMCDSGNIRRDSGNLERDSGNIRRDSGNYDSGTRSLLKGQGCEHTLWVTQ